jgi:enterochelin esterase-like enzyme
VTDASPASGDAPQPHRVLPWPVILATVAVVSGAATTGLLYFSGWVGDASITLIDMGFDPDRARLIASFAAGALACAVAALASGTRLAPIAMATLTFVIFFGRVFVQETGNATASDAMGGRFDPVGWLVTILALASAVAITGWSATTLALSTRRGLVGTIAAAAQAFRERRRRELWRPLVALLLVAQVVLLLPVLTDMFNFGPDARMRSGAGAPVGLFNGPADPGAPSVPPGVVPAPSAGLTIGPEPGTTVTVGAISTSRPWLSSRPTGSGSIITARLPAPWTGTGPSSVDVSIYLPPGYSIGSRAYPVIYEVPWRLSYWQGGVQLPPLLDNLIDSGRIPPEIMVFVSARGGPYPDNECVDSWDGRERWESFLTTTVVPWVDANLRTIASANARALFGFSTGGFCSANLLFRHPDIFRSAVAISGYYVAGLRTSQTLNAWRPFGNEPLRIAQNSPTNTAGLVPGALRRQLFVVLSGDPRESFYGVQMREFGAALAAAAIPYAWLPTALGHRWAAVREQLPGVLEAIAQRQAASGVFG